MATGYDPNIKGAITVIVDIMMGEGMTMAREPYAPNYRGLVDALIDLKEGFPTRRAGSLEIDLKYCPDRATKMCFAMHRCCSCPTLSRDSHF